MLEFPAYKTYLGAVDADGLPTSAARLCLEAQPTHCYALPEKRSDMQFGLHTKAQSIPLQAGGSLVIFSATFSGGGSGSLDELALLRCEPDGTLKNLLPVVQLTEQSDHAIWPLQAISPLPVLMTADYVWDWDKGETHFEKHAFEVRAYLYDFSKGNYSEKIRYRTSRRYASLDETDRVQVLIPERAEIIRRLRAR